MMVLRAWLVVFIPPVCIYGHTQTIVAVPLAPIVSAVGSTPSHLRLKGRDVKEGQVDQTTVPEALPE